MSCPGCGEVEMGGRGRGGGEEGREGGGRGGGRGWGRRGGDQDLGNTAG
jgi:hypothetical protein